MSKRNVLGRGLGALIQGVEKKEGNYIQCPIDEIVPNRLQPRRVFNKARLQELVNSIIEKGIIEPLVVRNVDSGYELIAGERRWRAAKVAGLKKVPAIIVEATNEESLEFAIIENIQREDLNAIEEAWAYRRLMESFSLSQEDVAKKVGKDRATVANYLRLLKLPDEVKDEIIKGTITMGHARAILAFDNHSQQREVCRKVIKKGLSVRETEYLVKKTNDTIKNVKPKVAHIAPLEVELREIFGTKVSVKEKRGKGKVEIEFYSIEELERVLELLRLISKVNP
ncbi:MAG: ParB/RepB/Spo0J family partition protein [Thermodesulfobacteriota bacterium]